MPRISQCVALLPIHFPPCAYVEWFDNDTQNEKSLNQRQTKYFSQIIFFFKTLNKAEIK